MTSASILLRDSSRDDAARLDNEVSRRDDAVYLPTPAVIAEAAARIRAERARTTHISPSARPNVFEDGGPLSTPDLVRISRIRLIQAANGRRFAAFPETPAADGQLEPAVHPVSHGSRMWLEELLFDALEKLSPVDYAADDPYDDRPIAAEAVSY